MRVALLLLALALGASAPAGAQMVAIDGGDVYLEVPYVGPGFGTGVDASTRLRWQGRQGDRYKITVHSATAATALDLSVTAAGVRRGRSAGTVPLVPGMFPQDFVTDLPPGRWNRNKVGEATLRYEATAPDGQPPTGADTHRITFTITQQ